MQKKKDQKSKKSLALNLKGNSSSLHYFFCNYITNKRFGSSPKIKFNKQKFYDDIESSWFAGFLTFAETLREGYINGEYKDLDILIGDIDYLSVKYYELYRKKMAINKIPPLSIEKLMRKYDNS